MTKLWQEWETGLPGKPAVSYLESTYHARWRAEGAERKFFQRRMRIIAYIQRLARDSQVEAGVVVAELEERCSRERMSLNQLSEKLRLNEL